MRCLRSSADINGEPPWEHQRVRAGLSRLLMAKLKLWLQAHRAKLSTHSKTAKGYSIQPQPLEPPRPRP
jgi:hypothetical protein